MKMVEAFGDVPWGMVPGVHDFEADLASYQLLERDMQAGGSTSQGTLDLFHDFTYVVPIEATRDDHMVVARAWFFGTGRHNCIGAGGYDCIRYD